MNTYRVIIKYTRYQFIKYIQKHKSYLVEKYPDFLRMEISEELMTETYQYAYAFLKESIKKGNVLRYENLTRNQTSLTDFAFRIAWLQYIYPEVFEIIDFGFGNPLNLEIAAKMYYESDDCLDFDRKEVLTAYQELQWMFSFENVENGNFIRSAFDMDERLYQYLMEEDSENTEYEGYAVLLPKDNLENELFIKEELAENICKDIAVRKHDNQTLLYQLAEEDFYCAKNVILQVQKERERGIVFLDYQKLEAMDKTRQQYICWKVLRECRLWSLDICITNLESKKENEISAFLKGFVMSNLNCWSVCYFTTDPLTELAVYIDRAIMRFRVKYPTREERMVLWKKYCDKQKLDQKLRYDIISTKFKLSSEQIKKGVTYLKYLEDGGEEINEKTISRVCTQLLPPPSQGTIKQVEVEYSLDDLKLPIRQKQILKNVCSHVFYEMKRKITDRLIKDSALYPLGRKVSLVQPYFVKLNVRVWLEKESLENAYDLQNRANEMIEKFIDPLNGGPGYQGWEIGEFPRSSQIIATLRTGISGCSISKILMTAEIEGKEVPVDESFFEKVQNPLIMAVNGEHIVYIEVSEC